MSLRMAKPELGPGRGVEAAELRHGQAEAALREGDVQVGREHARRCMPTVTLRSLSWSVDVAGTARRRR